MLRVMRVLVTFIAMLCAYTHQTRKSTASVFMYVLGLDPPLEDYAYAEATAPSARWNECPHVMQVGAVRDSVRAQREGER